MIVELHIIQNFAPANLNRDDTGSPKDCYFGGYRRARISSQAFKRAIRDTFRSQGLLPVEQLSRRTLRLVDHVTERLQAQGRNPDLARKVIAAVLASVGLSVDGENRTQYLLFLGETEIDNLAAVCLEHWDALVATIPTEMAGAAPTTGRRAGRATAPPAPNEVKQAALQVLNGRDAADLALFGRMIANLPEKNTDAACQVAHALSTNPVNVEFDYFTAVDDLQPNDNAGAGMIGTVEFNSSCFYRYANIDVAQLTKNLSGDVDLTARTVEAFIKASVMAIPTGKQNSMAAQNPPSAVFAVVRERGFWSLANAFVQPVRPTAADDLVQGSISRMDSYWGQLTAMYGLDGIAGAWACTLEDLSLEKLAERRVPNFSQLVRNVAHAVAAGGAA